MGTNLPTIQYTAHELYTLQLTIGDAVLSTPEPLEGREKTLAALEALQKTVLLHTTLRDNLTILLTTQWRTAQGTLSFAPELPQSINNKKISLETFLENMHTPYATYQLPITRRTLETIHS